MLYKQIITDLQTAMKQKDSNTLSVLRMVKKNIDDERIAAGDGDRESEPADELVLKVLKRYKKQLEDSIKDFEAGGRQDTVEQVRGEIKVVEKYLPEEMGDDAIDAIIQEVLVEIPEDQRDFGRIMGAVMKKVAGQADGGRVKAKVEAVLSS